MCLSRWEHGGLPKRGQKATALKRGMHGPRRDRQMCWRIAAIRLWWCRTMRARKAAEPMLLYEYTLKATAAQRAAIDGAIRSTQFLRNTCLQPSRPGGRLCRTAQLASPPGRCRPRLAGVSPLLRQLQRPAPRRSRSRRHTAQAHRGPRAGDGAPSARLPLGRAPPARATRGHRADDPQPGEQTYPAPHHALGLPVLRRR